MRRSRSRPSEMTMHTPLRPLFLLLVLLGPLLLTTSGCTLLAGQPWGQAELALSVELNVDDSRLTEEGWIKSANDYAFDLAELDVGLSAMRLLSTAASTSTEATGETFDPANPPPGYSLCHNGHCHHDDGRLVDYEDIQAELDGGGAVSGPVAVVSQRVMNSPLRLWPEADTIELEACADGCHIDRVSLSEMDVGITEVSFRAHVVDLRPASTARLPPEGVTVIGTVDAATLMDLDLEERFDRDQPLGLRVAAAVVLQPTVFDGIDVGGIVGTEWPTDEVYDLSDVVSVQDVIATNIEEDTTLLVDIDRFDPELSDNELALLPPPLEG
jgi:hypothetical protein